MSAVSLRAQLEIVSGYIDPSIKPTSVDDCDYTWDNTSYLAAKSLAATTTTMTPDMDNPQSSSKQLSFYYYSLFGMLITLVISNVVSLFIERSNDRIAIDSRLLAPMVRKLFINYTKKETEMKLVTHTFEHVNQKVDDPVAK